jgi:hypothetical protein
MHLLASISKLFYIMQMRSSHKFTKSMQMFVWLIHPDIRAISKCWLQQKWLENMLCMEYVSCSHFGVTRRMSWVYRNMICSCKINPLQEISTLSHQLRVWLFQLAEILSAISTFDSILCSWLLKDGLCHHAPKLYDCMCIISASF